MGGLRYSVGLCVLVLVVIFNTHAAPTDFPPRTYEGDTNVNPTGINSSLKANGHSEPKKPEVRTDERYHKVYDDGTVEFKTALSNGHIQYQRISNKVVDGKTMQVYVGYVSVPYADGRYGTTYYVADENGFRQTPVEIANEPPVLPKSGPISNDFYNSNDRGHELDYEQSTFEKNNNERVTKTPTGFETKPNEVLPTVEENVTNGVIENNVPIVPELPITEENIVKSSFNDNNLSTPSALPNIEDKLDGIVPALGESIGRTSSVSINSEANSEDHQLAEDNLDTSSEPKKAEENEISYELKNEGTPENVNNLSGQPITEQNKNEENIDRLSVLPITEDSKTIDDGLTPILDGTNNSQQNSSENEVNGSLPVTEDSEKSTEFPVITTVQDTNELKADDNKDATEQSSITESILASDIEDSDDSTVVTVLPTLQDEGTHEDVDSTSLPITEDSVTKVQETDVYAETTGPKAEDDNNIDGSGELPTTEENIVNETLSQNELNNEDTSEGSTDLPVDDEKVHEASTELPIVVTEEKILEVTTEVPELLVTEEISTSSHDVLSDKESHEATTDLSLEPSTETDKTELIQGEISTELPSAHDISSDEEKNHEASTEIQKSSATDEISATSSNDEVTTNIATTTSEQSAEDSATSASAEAHTEKLPEMDAASITEDTNLDASTDGSSEDVIKNEASTELPSLTEDSSDEEKLHDASTIVPALQVTEDISSKIEEAKVVEIEGSTELPSSSDIPVEQEKNHETSTEIPAVQVTEEIASAENVIISEATTVLPTFDENTLNESTEIPAPAVPSDVQVEDLSGLDVDVQNASSKLPSLTKIEEEIKAHDEDVVTTDLPDKTHPSENTTYDASTEIPELPVTDEISIKSADDNVIQTEASTEIPASNSEEAIKNDVEKSDKNETVTEGSFLTNLFHSMKFF